MSRECSPGKQAARALCAPAPPHAAHCGPRGQLALPGPSCQGDSGFPAEKCPLNCALERLWRLSPRPSRGHRASATDPRGAVVGGHAGPGARPAPPTGGAPAGARSPLASRPRARAALRPVGAALPPATARWRPVGTRYLRGPLPGGRGAPAGSQPAAGPGPAGERLRSGAVAPERPACGGGAGSVPRRPPRTPTAWRPRLQGTPFVHPGMARAWLRLASRPLQVTFLEPGDLLQGAGHVSQSRSPRDLGWFPRVS